MKAVIAGIAIGLIAFTAQAQNKNVTDVSKTTVTTVKDSQGAHQVVKKENTQEVQNIEFQNADSNALNKDMKTTPVQVMSTVQVTGPDGKTRTVDVDRSAYYNVNGQKYKVSVDNVGYTLTDPTGKRAGLLRQMGNNSYIYRSGNVTSFANFDDSGNLVISTYDDKNDKITTTTYSKNQ
jgi:hypothetical protein